MKSEHRHELKTNDLNRLTTEWGHLLEHYLLQHTGQLVAIGVLVLAIGLGFYYWRTTSGALDSEGWRALAAATSAAELGNVADKYAGTNIGAWARLREAESELGSGIRLLFTDRDAGRSDMKKAQESFEKIIADKSTPPEVLERALFGLATAREALPEKSTKASEVDDPAIATYERLVREFPDSVYKSVAEARIAALRTGTAQDFYLWFASQNPKPTDREMPKDLIPPLPDGPASGKSGANDLFPTGDSPAKKAPADGKQGGAAPAEKAPAKDSDKSAPKTNAGGASGKAAPAAPASK